MRRARPTLIWLVALVALSPAAAIAAFPGTEVFLPSVGKGPGAAGSNWSTTLWIHNPSASPANVQVFLLLRNQANPSPQVANLTVQGGDTVRLADALDELFAATGFGALRVVSTQRLVVNSRIFSVGAGESEADSVGQFFAAVPASFAIASGQSTSILGVFQTSPQQDSDYRTNFGFVETTGRGATVRVTARDPGGATLSTKDYPLAGFEPRQVNIADLLPADHENLRLSVEVIAGTGAVVAFGSALANRSSDPSTLEMSFRDELLGGGTGGLSTVTHDTTLAGDGTASSPLGIAAAGVTPGRISAAGSSAGQVLTSDGAAVSWQTPTAGAGLSLPYDGNDSTTTAPSSVFEITSHASGYAIRGVRDNLQGVLGHSSGGVRGEAVGLDNYGVLGGETGVFGHSAGQMGVAGESAGSHGVMGTTTATGAAGVRGQTAVAASWGVSGLNTDANAGVGVRGEGNLAGVHGVSTKGIGVVGEGLSGSGSVAGVHAASGNAGLLGTSTGGVVGTSVGEKGVWGSSDVVGSVGTHTPTGNYGELGAATFGVRGVAFSGNAVIGQTQNGAGVIGTSQTNDGIKGQSSGAEKSGVYGVTDALTGFGVFGRNTAESSWGYLGGESGVYGYAPPNGGVGVYGYGVSGTGVVGAGGGGFDGVSGVSQQGNGLHGYSEHKYGVWARSDYSYAGYFYGNVNVTNTLTKGGGAFVIDHPLDPERRLLYHSFVESPDMKNVYDGVVELDSEGRAVVELPEWFEALNRDYRYQLTCLREWAPVYVAGEIAGNRFLIAGGAPGMRVSWQVTGIRHDAFANANRIPVEQNKPPEDVGAYLHPAAFGLPLERSVEWARDSGDLVRPKPAPPPPRGEAPGPAADGGARGGGVK